MRKILVLKQNHKKRGSQPLVEIGGGRVTVRAMRQPLSVAGQASEHQVAKDGMG